MIERRTLQRAGSRIALILALSVVAASAHAEPADAEFAADFAEASLSSADFSRANLGGTSFRAANLRMAKMAGANLVGANLSGADLVRADFSGADLSGSDLRFAKAIGVDWRGATLAGADLSNGDFTEGLWGGVSLARAQLRKARINGVWHWKLWLALTGTFSKGAEVKAKIEEARESDRSRRIAEQDAVTRSRHR